DVLQALHPTPAVCGLPKEEALRFILANEPDSRGYSFPCCCPWERKTSTSGRCGRASCTKTTRRSACAPCASMTAWSAAR
ncbi:MAG: chorismate-binding protein, partial [Oscillospiraceae bacterium]|nr:chorismate-binding protein [Oscillospiraceae bacterium]